MSAYDALLARLQDVDAVHAAIALMDWDHQTYMPKGGAPARAEHVSRLSRMAHEIFTSDETQAMLAKAEAEGGDEDVRASLRVVRRQMDQSTKLPAELVAEKSKVTSEAHEVWVTARQNSDFAAFRPSLELIVELCRQEADCLGFTDHVYDALTDLYEEGATKAGWDAMFDGIRQPLVELVAEIKQAPQADNSFLYGDWSKADQQAMTEKLVRAVGFDFGRGRQDTAPHPFCTNWSVGDVRLTTRYLDDVSSAVFSSLHEAGHGMYEQGSPSAWDRTPLVGGVSLGVHESQSRLWENIVGRSRAFWTHWYPEMQATFPRLASVSLDQWIRGINRVEPSFIRVEADEVTYNLHIMVRYELECAMLTGELAPRDLPEAWNEKYRAYLGITPPDDRQGCLQDVHWSGGSMGYFPTYSMGNLLSFQIWERLTADLGDVDGMLATGDCRPVFEWLLERVYRQGSKFPPSELIQRVTGKPLSAEAYLRGIRAKYGALYGLAAV